MKISIFGLGYVGTVSFGCLARDGHEVVGVDIDETKLELLRSGRTPIIEEGMQDLISSVMESGRARVTSDIHEAVQNTDLSFVCVGTPSRPNGSQDVVAIERVSEQIGEAIRDKAGYHAIIIRSTVVPGTVRSLVVPALEQSSGKKEGKDFGVGFQPEFLREGSSIRDYDNPPFTIVGAESPELISTVKSVFEHLPGEFVASSIGTAEMVKYCCNAFHALKATFANEIGRISQGFGIDSHEVMDLVCRDKQLNISTAYMRPGFSFGGSCLPKDLRAVMRMAQDLDVSVPMLGNVLNSNSVHTQHAIDSVLSTGKRQIAMIGLSFKSGTDDLRESPLVTMAEQLIGKGMHLRIFDPEVNLARLIGANRRYIEEAIPHIASLMVDSVESAVSGADVVIVGLSDRDIVGELPKHIQSDQVVLDLVNMPNREAFRGQYRGVCW